MIITMITARMMQMSAHYVINMVAVRNSFMPTSSLMFVGSIVPRALVLRRTTSIVGTAYS